VHAEKIAAAVRQVEIAEITHVRRQRIAIREIEGRVVALVGVADVLDDRFAGIGIDEMELGFARFRKNRL
jgi:hypothetical protein